MITCTARNLSILLVLLFISTGCDSTNIESAMEEEEKVSGEPGEVKVGDEAMHDLVRELERFERGNANGSITISNTDGENLTPKELLILLRSHDTTDVHERSETRPEPRSGLGRLRGISTIVTGDEPPSYRAVGFTAIGFVDPGDPNRYNEMDNRKRVGVGDFNNTATKRCRGWDIRQCSTSFTYYLSGSQVDCSLRTRHNAYYKWGSGGQSAFSGAYSQC